MNWRKDGLRMMPLYLARTKPHLLLFLLWSGTAVKQRNGTRIQHVLHISSRKRFANGNVSSNQCKQFVQCSLLFYLYRSIPQITRNLSLSFIKYKAIKLKSTIVCTTRKQLIQLVSEMLKFEKMCILKTWSSVIISFCWLLLSLLSSWSILNGWPFNVLFAMLFSNFFKRTLKILNVMYLTTLTKPSTPSDT